MACNCRKFVKSGILIDRMIKKAGQAYGEINLGHFMKKQNVLDWKLY